MNPQQYRVWVTQSQLEQWIATGNAIMLCATGKESPLSDSDVCGEIDRLRAQVDELTAVADRHAILLDALKDIERLSSELRIRHIASVALNAIWELQP